VFLQRIDVTQVTARYENDPSGRASWLSPLGESANSSFEVGLHVTDDKLSSNAHHGHPPPLNQDSRLLPNEHAHFLNVVAPVYLPEVSRRAEWSWKCNSKHQNSPPGPGMDELFSQSLVAEEPAMLVLQNVKSSTTRGSTWNDHAFKRRA
jgi:hypothetical protein